MSENEVIIGTRLDSKQLDRDLKSEYKKLQQFEKEAEKLAQQKLKIEAEVNLKENELANKIKNIKEKAKIKIEATTGRTQGERLEKTKTIELQTQQTINDLYRQQEMYVNEMSSKYDGITQKIKQNARNQALINKNISDMSSKLNKVKGFEGIKQSVDNINNSISNSIKKVGRWALAVIGVRSVYLGIRSAMSTLTQTDDELAAKVEYMRWALATALKPVIEWIINALYTILGIVAQIIKAFTGYNIFENSGIKDYQKAMAKSGKNAKELQKTLAGFDEMNVINENGSVGTAGSGIPSGNYNLQNPGEGPTPEWLKFIVDNKDAIIATLAGIAAGLIAIKLGFSGLQSLGIGVAIAGIVLAVEGIIAYLNDPSWSNFGTILGGIALAVLGVAIAFGAWPVAIGAALAFALSFVVKYWEQIKGVLQGGIDWLMSKTDWVKENLGYGIGAIYEFIVSIFQGILDWFDTIFNSMKDILDGIIQVVKGVFTGDWSMAWEGVKKIFGGILDGIWGTFKFIFTTIGNFFKTIINFIVGLVRDAWNIVTGILGAIGSWIYDHIIKPVGDFFAGMWNGFKEGARQAWEGVKNIFGAVAGFFRDIFTNAWEGVKRVFSKGGEIFKGIADGIFEVFKKVVNAIIDGINSVVKIPFDGINGALKGLKGVDLWGWKPFDWLPEIKAPQIPHLARGTILNNPGKGVPVAGGNAIAGEAGREAYLPLSDSQLLEELGSSIGKYVTLNATIPVYVGNRQIAREIQKINAENDFAYNR